MLESKWEIDTEEGRGWEYNGNLPSLFFEQKTNRLEELLKSYIKSGRRYNYDLYQFTLREGFLIKHTNEILCSLQENGFLDVILTESNNQARKKSFYIKYMKPDDVNKNKVYFNIK